MRKRELKGQIVWNIIFIVICLLVLFPFVLVVSVSFSNEQDIARYGYSLLPRHFDLAAYKYVFKNPEMILDAYKVTFEFSIIFTILSVFFMACFAFLLSKKNLPGKAAVSFFLYFTMLFSGGLVPTYILITQYLHLNDTIWVYILPCLISPWYVFMMRTFFSTIPYEMTEAVKIDGGSEYTIFFKIILPLSKPVIASVALFQLLGKWNDWYTAMLYINDRKLISLQYMLQRILENIRVLQESTNMGIQVDLSKIPSETVRMAMAIIVAGPMLVVFPFFQKYFVKGMTVGAVKG